MFSGVIVLYNNAPDTTIPTNIIVHANSVLYGSRPIDPAGPGAATSAVGQIVTGINETRANTNGAALVFSRTISGQTTNYIEIPATFVNADGLTGSFEHVGDILSVPEINALSPFLSLNANGAVDGAQLQNGISDEMYEWLPQQVMSLLHVSDSPRYVIYSYGQTLKPAPNGISTANITLANGQPAFGMITNYQVTAEAATRAVVRFNGTRLNNVVLTNDGTIVNLMIMPSITNNNAVVEQFNPLPSN